MATRLEEVREGGGRGTYADLDDRFLVLDFQAGNGDRAFEEIHRRYSGLARHVCQNILRNPEDADEATQETMLRVYQGLPRFNGRYMVQPWVARIATNVCLDIVRARQRRPVADLPIDHAHDTAVELEDRAPEIIVERKLERDRVKAALDALPPHHRRALVLREFEGRSHEEIARALDITPKQAKALIHRAKAAFRRVWDADRHGLAAIVPILLAPFRLPEAARRLIGSAGEAAAGSGTVAATPIVSTTVVNAGERVAAAAVAIAMATTVSVGAVTLRDRLQKDHQPVRHRERQTEVVASPAPAPAPATDDSKAVIVDRPRTRTRERPPNGTNERHATDAKQVATQPVVEPSVVPSPTASTEASDSPSPTETTSPAPPPAAPDWAMQFSMIGKTASLTQLSSKVSGTAGESIQFNETASGKLGVVHPVSVQARYFGSAEGSDGTAMLWLILDTANGRYQYEGTGTLEPLGTAEDGTIAYTFSGAYTLTEAPVSDDSRLGKKLSRAGSFELVLNFWQDQATLYKVGLSMAATEGTDQTLAPA